MELQQGAYLATLVGLACVAAGVAMSLAVYDPISGEIHCMPLFYLTPTGFSFIGTGVLYYLLSLVPPVRKYLFKDRNDITI